MSEQTTAPRGAPDESPHMVAVGFVLFAAVMMALAGAFQTIAGISGIIQDDFYLSTSDYVFELDSTTWGWVHLLIGLVVLTAAFALMSGKAYGRVVGVVMATFSALTNFAFLPHYPIWALTIITLNILVIWAITAHGGRLHE